jgi:hypothetical protein
MSDARFDPHDHITPVIYDICARYGVTINWAQEKETEDWEQRVRLKADCPDFSWSGLGDCGFSFQRQYVYACAADPAHVFHEFIHCILGQESTVICEGYFLMQFEWELAKWASRRMKADRRFFMERVNAYQEETYVRFSSTDSGIFRASDRRQSWWRNGLRRAQALGLLDNKLAPTFKRPKWKGSGVKRARNWSVATDHMWTV